MTETSQLQTANHHRNQPTAHLYRIRPGPDEGNPLLLAAPRKRGVLRQEPVARVDGIDVRLRRVDGMMRWADA